MNIKKDLTEYDCEKCRALCNFSDDERAVFDLRVKNRGVIEIAMALNMSESTVRRRIHDIQAKVYRVL